MPNLENVVLLVTATATGLTQALATTGLAEREQHLIGWFAMCPGPLWGDMCQVPSWSNKQCYPMPPELNSAVQSASPVKSGAKGTCFLYHEKGCKGEGTPPITYPGVENFEAGGIYGSYKSWGV